MLRCNQFNPLSSATRYLVADTNPKRKWLVVQNVNQATNNVIIYLEDANYPVAYLDKYDSFEISLNQPYYGKVYAYCAGDAIVGVSEYD